MCSRMNKLKIKPFKIRKVYASKRPRVDKQTTNNISNYTMCSLFSDEAKMKRALKILYN